MIPLFYPQIFKQEWLKIFDERFDTRWLGQGPMVDEFENQFGQKFGYEYCLAVNSGSAALELAYHLVGIGKGDEVITPVFTCTATNLPLIRRKAKIVFADIDDTLTIDYEDVRKKITKRTKAIVVVTLGGLAVNERIFRLAASIGVPVIIDAAQSLGVSERFGDYICYSFQAIKHFTTGDGGMLVLRDPEIYQRAKKLRWFGIDRVKKKAQGWRCMVNHQMAQEIEEAGYKFHMNDIAASMGIVGLKHSDEVLKYRKACCIRYMENLSTLPATNCVCGGSYWLFAILTDKRDLIMDCLRESKIECDLIQLRNDVFKVFGGKRLKLPNMNKIESKYLYLPLNGLITFEMVDMICEAIWWFSTVNRGKN